MVNATRIAKTTKVNVEYLNLFIEDIRQKALSIMNAENFDLTKQYAEEYFKKTKIKQKFEPESSQPVVDCNEQTPLLG